MGLLWVLLLALQPLALAEDNGLALTPPMGWNPWNCYASDISEDIVLAEARTMQEKLLPLGYQYINLDCGWSTTLRDPKTGELLVNKTRFPHGMKWLGEQLHAMGLKFGIYGALGYGQCCSGTKNPKADDGSGPGCSRDGSTCRNKTYFRQDAALWASWGVDFLKFDGCGGPFESVDLMRAALLETKRSIVYSVHSSVEQGEMNASLANMWRVGADIGASYEQAIDRAMISNTVNAYIRAAPGGWNDPDMMIVGNIGTKSPHGSPPSLFPDAEGRTQFALWCITKAPLLVGTFLHNVSAAALATLTAKPAIEVNQDPLGEQGVLVRDGGWVPDKPRPTTNKAFGFQVWTSALSNGGAAAVLANLDGNASRPLTLKTSDLPASRAATSKWNIVEAFGGASMTGVQLPKTVTVPPHDVVMWVLTASSP